MSLKLQNKIALVTGAAGGLGQGIAKALAAEGALVVVNDFCEEARIQAVVHEIEAAGGRAWGIRADVGNSAAVQAMFDATAEHFGTVHILVNNAAVLATRPQDEPRRVKHYDYLTKPVPRESLQFTSQISDEEWLRFWDVNVHGVFYCTRAALRLMEPQREGKIINIASVAGFSAMSAHSPHYSATKGAVIAFSKSVAAEVAGSNIFVNVVAPGGVQTQDFDNYLAHVGEEAQRRFWQVIPAGRLGSIDEYAQTVTYLAGSHYFVGQVLSPNGGAVI